MSESKTLETQTSSLMDATDPELVDDTKHQGGDEEEEEEECGFCLFMKAGGCRDNFIAWEDCIADAEKNKEDIVEKCAQVTATLRQCMEAHQDYYAPLLQAEKAVEEQVNKELEEEKASKVANENVAPAN